MSAAYRKIFDVFHISPRWDSLMLSVCLFICLRTNEIGVRIFTSYKQDDSDNFQLFVATFECGKHKKYMTMNAVWVILLFDFFSLLFSFIVRQAAYCVYGKLHTWFCCSFFNFYLFFGAFVFAQSILDSFQFVWTNIRITIVCVIEIKNKKQIGSLWMLPFSRSFVQD